MFKMPWKILVFLVLTIGMYNARKVLEFIYFVRNIDSFNDLDFMADYFSLLLVLFTLTCFTIGLMIVDYLKSYPKNNELF